MSEPPDAGERLGDAPIDPEVALQMREVARVIDGILNDLREPRKRGFVLLTFPIGEAENPRCSYISNAKRSDVVTMLHEQLARFEGMPTAEGHG